MKQRPRIYYTDTQKALMWDRWRAYPLCLIAVHVRRLHSRS